LQAYVGLGYMLMYLVGLPLQ